MAKNCCPLCGCPLRRVEYRGKDPERLAMMKREDFCGYMGCLRTDLHHGKKVFIHPVFHAKVWRHEPVKRKIW